MVIKRLNKIKYFKDSSFKYSLPLNTKLNYGVGEMVKKGDILGTTRDFEILESFNLIDKLKVKLSEIKKYLKVFDKEYISIGDQLAVRVVMGGLGRYEVISSTSGFIDLSEIKKGTLKILGEIKEGSVISNATGKIDTIIQGDYLEVNTNVLSFSLSTSFGKGEYMGEFIYISKDSDVDKLEIGGKVIFVNDVLDKKMYLKLNEYSPKAIISTVISSEFSGSSYKIHNVFSMFGVSDSFTLNKIYVNNLSRMGGLSTFVSSKENLFSFSVDKVQDTKNENFIELKTGMKVVVTSSSLFGLEVNVITINDFDLEVKTEDGNIHYLTFDEVAYIC